MAGRISTQIALLAFAVAIVAGLCAGNSPGMVLQRALVAMFVGLLIGKLVGWSTRLVLRDHLQRKKLAIDQAHCTAATSRHTEGIENKSQTVETG
jgi:NhaP-type Na+/H+ or K+/H+ antiporter